MVNSAGRVNWNNSSIHYTFLQYSVEMNVSKTKVCHLSHSDSSAESKGKLVEKKTPTKQNWFDKVF